MISLLTPSLGRPVQCLEMAESVAETASGPVELVLVVEDTDPAYDDYVSADWPIRPVVVHAPAKSKPSTKWQMAYEASHGDFTFHGQDDVRFRTPAWDDRIREAFNEWDDRIGMVWVNDGHHRQRLAALFFLSRQWIDTVGYYVPDDLFFSYYLDNWVHDLARRIDRLQYLDDVFVEHLAVALGKARQDATWASYHSGNEPGRRAYHDNVFRRQMDAARLQEAIGWKS